MKKVLVVSAVLAVAALPASAQEPRTVEVADPCGDAAVLTVDGGGVVAGDAAHDLAALRVSDLVVDDRSAGLEVALDLCGDAGAETAGGSWGASWRLADGCRAELTLGERYTVSERGVEPGRVAGARVLCPADGDELVEGSEEVRDDIALDRSAYAVGDRQVVWRLERGAVGPLEDVVRSGAAVRGASAYGRSATATGSLVVASRAQVTPFGSLDLTGAAPDHVVG